MDHGTRNHFTLVEIIAYALLIGIIGVGFYLAVLGDAQFRAYVVEDGVLETGTAVLMLVGAIIVFVRFLRERRSHPWTFTAFSIFTTILLIFVAGEEISWGQRIFNVESNEFFLNNNIQNETNLHNMAINGVNLNRLGAKFLSLFLILYYVVLPYFYSRRGAIHRWMSHLCVPVPKIHNGIMLLIFAIVIDQIPSPKRGELNEVCLSIFVILLVAYAQNIRHGKRW